MRHYLARVPIFDFFVGRPVSGWLPLGVGLALLSALLIPLNLLASQPFHHDEALYATWALEIASGHNPWLAEVPLDKPPLFLYVVAGAMRLLGTTAAVARLPSLLATVVTVGLTFWLGRTLYSPGVGLLAAWLVALSPLTILFAPTAFTDPLLTTLALAACLAAASGRAGWAGLWLGLAIATKQQGLFFGPLVAALFVAGSRDSWRLKVRRFTLSVLLVFLLLFLWDSVRHQSPGIWQLSLANYGGLTTALGSFGARWAGFLDLLRYGTASPVLNTIFLIGLPLLLGYGFWQIKNHGWFKPVNLEADQSSTLPSNQPHSVSQAQFDWLLFLFCLFFLCLHAWLSFQLWERYLLGLIPFLALLLARILWWPWAILNRFGHKPPSRWRPIGNWAAVILLGLLLVFTLARPVQDAAQARYPLGSKSQALQGVEQITAYLQGHAGARTTLYHRWLGTHWRFYLWKYPYDLQYWQSPRALAAKVRAGHLIAFPSWKSDTEARLALAGAGLELQEVSRAYTAAGYPSIILYEIKPIAENSR